ncbi:MAG: ATP-binding protein [Bacteroidaceae bacterium]|nr:ATP-binding protein [Bacteroidaceae bacterium]
MSNPDSFTPNKSSWTSNQLDKKSVLLLDNLFCDKLISTHIETGGTMPNIDGTIELLNPDKTIKAKVTVQIKHLTNPLKEGLAYYDIPQSILGYAHRIKGEVVIFIACDTNNSTFYWKYINDTYIDECAKKSENFQGTYRYYFTLEETANSSNIDDTIAKWSELYREKIESIRDIRKDAEDFVKLNKDTFDTIDTTFHSLQNSHIKRKETQQLYSWIINELEQNAQPIKMLVGNAGIGKSVVIKDLLNQLDEQGIFYFPIKADRKYITENDNDSFSLKALQSTIDILSANREKIVLIIDQIDALSRCLSNDKDKLNNIVNIVDSLKEDTIKDVRIIISCRKYDLEYDAILNKYNNLEAIELKKLTKDEVKNVLNQLDPSIQTSLSDKTLQLLATPQYLDVFCRIYSTQRKAFDIASPIDLYDKLWNHLIEDAPNGITPKSKIEKVLFDIANTIHTAETLNPTWTASADELNVSNFLASESIIRLEHNHVSFFHQSFYEYVLAKYYVTNNKSFFEDLENEFQGIELRSTVKLILDYERGHSDQQYKTDIERIIFSDSIRFHIKQIAISVLSSATDIKPIEKKVVKRLPEYDSKLLSYFLNNTREEAWYNTIIAIIKPLLPTLLAKDEMFSSIVNCLGHYVFFHSEEVYQLVDTINDEETRNTIALLLMRNHNNYRNERVRQWYFMQYDKDPFFLTNKVVDALSSNYKFAIEETKKLLLKFLITEKGKSEHHSEYEIVDILCKRLNQEHSKDLLLLLSDCFCEIFKNNYHQFYQYHINEVIKPNMSTYVEKLYEYYENLLQKFATNSEIIKPIVKNLMDLNDEMSLVLAFETMALNPTEFDVEIRAILTSNEKTEQYLDGHFEYYFLELLKAWYQTLNDDDASWYQNILLNFKSKRDNIVDKERKYTPKLYHWYLWRSKQKLICCTIPEKALSPELKRCKQELERRFVKNYVNEKRNDDCIIHSCGGIVSQEVYEKFSLKSWNNSFLKLDGSHDFRHGEFRPYSLNEHANAFEKCVSKRPEFFKTFVFQLFDVKNMNQLYLIAGLEGLFDGGINIDELWTLYKRFLTTDFIDNNHFEFEKLTKFYFNNDNKYIDEILSFLINTLKQPIQEKEQLHIERQGENEISGIATDLLTQAYNSKQGTAINLILSMCRIESRRKQAYQTLMNLKSTLSPSLKLMILNYIYVKDSYDEALFEKLFPLYLSELGTEALAVCSGAIQNFYYHKTDLINPYIEKILPCKNAWPYLVQLFFYGTPFENIKAKCLENIEKILSSNDEDSIAKLIEISCNYNGNEVFANLSKSILTRYASDNRESIKATYRSYCDKLPIESFELFCTFSKDWKHNTRRDIQEELKYLEKCSGRRPVECYQYIKNSNYFSTKESRIVGSEIVILLVKIYKKLKEDSELDSMNELMDIFDEYIAKENYVVLQALQKLEE